LKDILWNSSVLDVHLFDAADYDADHSLYVAKVRKRLPVCKQISQRFHVERFSIK
jgi:hypothetical protein